ncbi:uncharacterized protein LOC143063430 [Mytilus galloprovincialis]|uniref:uncharacterized protein LOC143063430 n=1 Tax=Mytilus galloprovincialis TaxID=29158 RepID=UPI003F7B4D62
MCIAKRTSEDVIFRWACGFISQHSRIRNNSTSVWTKIQLKVDSAFDNKPCICTLQSTRTSFSVSDSVVLEVEKSPLLTLKEEFSCNISESVTLVCSVRGDLAIFGFEPWRHSIDGTYIRSLKGSNDAYVSLLFINTCSYQDAGEYTCIVWNTHTGETFVGNTTTTLVVTGPPVILKKETSQIGPRNIFVLLIYTRPIIVGVQVQCSGELLNTSADMTTEIKRETLELNFHGKVVIVGALRYTIALTNKHCVSQKFSICINNKFDEQCEIFEPQKDIEEDMNYLWLIVGVGFIVLIVVVIVVVFIVYKKHSIYRYKSGNYCAICASL